MLSSKKIFIFRKSPLAMGFLTKMVCILSIIFYLVMRKSELIESTIFGMLILLSICYLLTKKVVHINASDKSITITVDLIGVTLSKAVTFVPAAAVVQLNDTYEPTGQGHSACWLSIDVMGTNGGSVLPLAMQNKLTDSSLVHRKKLVEIADHLAIGFGLKVEDLRSSRYRD